MQAIVCLNVLLVFSTNQMGCTDSKSNERVRAQEDYVRRMMAKNHQHLTGLNGKKLSSGQIRGKLRQIYNRGNSGLKSNDYVCNAGDKAFFREAFRDR